MSDMQTFPETVDEFMEHYKIIDKEQVYTNGIELIPIFRMKQWFEHLEQKKGEWKECGTITIEGYRGCLKECSKCHSVIVGYGNFCPICGTKMEGEKQNEL